MTTKRIRCSCGRVYDPVKRPACPDCGTINTVIAAPPEPEPETKKEAPVVDPVPSPRAPRLLPISSRTIAIGGGALLLLLLVIALNRCGSPKPEPAPTPTPAPSASPSASSLPSAAPSARATPEASASATAPVEPSVAPPARSGILDNFDLNAAIAAAAPGATIKVPPGSYPGGLVIEKAVRLVGATGQVLIQSEGRECVTVRASGVALQNIQFVCNGTGALPAVSVASGADLSLETCQVQSNTALGLLGKDKSSIKARGTTFAVPEGTGIRLTDGARAVLTQCTFAETKCGLNAWSGTTAELHACAFDRVGGNDGRGAIMALTGQGAAATADDCHFNNNRAGILVTRQAALTITKSTFKENAGGVQDGILGLIAISAGARATLTGDRFESNRQGIAVTEGGTLELRQCTFVRNGIAQRQIVPTSLPLLVSGENSAAVVGKSEFADSPQFAIGVMAGGKLTLDEGSISGSGSAGVLLGERNTVPPHATMKGMHFVGNNTGLALLGGSSAEVEDCEFRENITGALVADRGSKLQARKSTFVLNRDRGVYAYLQASARLVDCDLKNNGRGALSGARGRAAERGSITLENCRLGGNTIFGVGASVQSEIILTNCVFDGTDKLNISKERGATVRTNEPAPSATPPPPDSSDAPSPAESADPSGSPAPEESPSPSAARATLRPRNKPTPRPRPPTPEDIRRALRKLLPGN